MDWKIHYHDLSTFSSEDGRWSAAPQEGVQIVVLPSPELGRYWLHKHAFYVFRPGLGDVEPLPVNDLYSQLVRWGITPVVPFPDQSNLRDYLDSLGVLQYVKFGMAISRDDWEAVALQAIHDPDLPPGFSPQRRVTDTEG